MDIELRSRRYSPEFRAEIAAIGAVQLTVIAAGWRKNITNPFRTYPVDPALAAYFQSAAERRMRADMFHGTIDEYIALLKAVATI